MQFDIDINILETVIRTFKTAATTRTSFAILNKTCVTADEEKQSVTFIAHLDSHKRFTPVSVTVFAPYVVVYEDGVAVLDLSAKTVKFAPTEKKSATAYVCVSDNAILIKDGSYLRQIIAKKGDVEEYPSVETPSRNAKTVGYIDVGRLKLANVYSSEDTTRDDFVGVLATDINGNLGLVSTDGHRLGAFAIQHYHGEPLDLEELPKDGFFIPTAWVKTIADSRADRMRLDVDNGEHKFRLTAQLQDGVKFDIWGKKTDVQFPDFSKVVPPLDSSMTRYILEGNPKTLSDICKTELANIVKTRLFAIRKDGSTIKKTGDGQTVETPIHFKVEPGADFNGQPIGINLGFIKDTLDIIASEWKSTSTEIVFYVIDQDMPVTVIANGDESMKHVLMPMQV